MHNVHEPKANIKNVKITENSKKKVMNTSNKRQYTKICIKIAKILKLIKKIEWKVIHYWHKNKMQTEMQT